MPQHQTPMVYQVTQSGMVHIYHRDLLGNIVPLLDENGEPANVEYEAHIDRSQLERIMCCVVRPQDGFKQYCKRGTFGPINGHAIVERDVYAPEEYERRGPTIEAPYRTV